ncbi:MAG TPA: hypothetical protein VID67_11870 [Rhizomicrobium sp.]
MNNQDRKSETTEVRPTREDMIAFVANGRQRPDAQWAICLGGPVRGRENPLV